jgi:hypothetical protein
MMAAPEDARSTPVAAHSTLQEVEPVPTDAPSGQPAAAHADLDRFLDDLEEIDQLITPADGAAAPHAAAMTEHPAAEDPQSEPTALIDPAEPELEALEDIEGQPGPGPAQPDAEAPKPRAASLHVVEGDYKDKIFELSDEIVRLGRGPENQIRLSLDGRLSRNHARVERRGSDYVLVDNESFNGCYVNGKRVTEKLLQPNDEVLIGLTKMVFHR